LKKQMGNKDKKREHWERKAEPAKGPTPKKVKGIMKAQRRSPRYPSSDKKPAKKNEKKRPQAGMVKSSKSNTSGDEIQNKK